MYTQARRLAFHSYLYNKKRQRNALPKFFQGTPMFQHISYNSHRQIMLSRQHVYAKGSELALSRPTPRSPPRLKPPRPPNPPPPRPPEKPPLEPPKPPLEPPKPPRRSPPSRSPPKLRPPSLPPKLRPPPISVCPSTSSSRTSNSCGCAAFPVTIPATSLTSSSLATRSKSRFPQASTDRSS